MLSNRKNKEQQNRKKLSHINNFDQEFSIVDAASGEGRNVEVDDRQIDREFTINTNNSMAVAIESTLDIQTLETSLIDRIAREVSCVVEKIENRSQNAVLTSMFSNIIPCNELVVISMNASSGRNVGSITANSERGEQVERITAFFESASSRNNRFQLINMTDETRGYAPGGLSDFPVSRTHYGWQSHTHHRGWGGYFLVTTGGSGELTEKISEPGNLQPGIKKWPAELG